MLGLKSIILQRITRLSVRRSIAHAALDLYLWVTEEIKRQIHSPYNIGVGGMNQNADFNREMCVCVCVYVHTTMCGGTIRFNFSSVMAEV